MEGSSELAPDPSAVDQVIGEGCDALRQSAEHPQAEQQQNKREEEITEPNEEEIRLAELEEGQNLLEEKQNVLEEKRNLMEEEQDLLEEERNLMEDEQNLMEDEQSLMGGKQNLLEEEQDLLEEERNLMKEKQNLLEEQRNLMKEKQNLLEEQQYQLEEEEEERNVLEERLLEVTEEYTTEANKELLNNLKRQKQALKAQRRKLENRKLQAQRKLGLRLLRLRLRRQRLRQLELNLSEHQQKLTDTKPSLGLSGLPLELLEEIFSWLPAKTVYGPVPKVCSLWRELVDRRCPCRSLSFEEGYGGGEEFSTDTAQSRLRTATRLRFLKLYRCADANDLLSVLPTPSRCLRRLELLFCDGLRGEVLAGAVTRCPNLSELSLQEGSVVGSGWLRGLGARLPRLRALTVTSFQWDEPITLREVVGGCKALEVVREFSFSVFCSYEDTAYLAQRFAHSLQELDTCGLALGDADLFALTGCRALRSLRLASARNITDTGLRELAALAGLESLDLSYAEQVTREGWVRFLYEASWLCGLRRLRLVSCQTVDDYVAAAIGATCPNLKRADLSVTMVTKAGLDEMFRCCPSLKPDFGWTYFLRGREDRLKGRMPRRLLNFGSNW